MTTRRDLLWLVPPLTAMVGLGLTGCVAYPAYRGPVSVAAGVPTMVWLPSLGVYVAIDGPTPLFYAGGTYYSSYGGGWYAGPGYHGPWRSLAGPPPMLGRFQLRDWPGYRARANSYYRANPSWRHFRPQR